MAGRTLCDTVIDNADAASMKVVRLCMLSSNKWAENTTLWDQGLSPCWSYIYLNIWCVCTCLCLALTRLRILEHKLLKSFGQIQTGQTKTMHNKLEEQKNKDKGT